MLFYTRTSSSQSLEKKEEFFRNLGTSPAVKYSTLLLTVARPSPGLLSLDVQPFVPCYVLGRRAEFHLCFIFVGVGYKLPGTRETCVRRLGSRARLEYATGSLLHSLSLPNLPAQLGDANLGSDPRHCKRGECSAGSGLWCRIWDLSDPVVVWGPFQHPTEGICVQPICSSLFLTSPGSDIQRWGL